jgi:hypothetical protein
MATPHDFTTRARDEMFGVLQGYEVLRKRIADLTDEVAANGGGGFPVSAGRL